MSLETKIYSNHSLKIPKDPEEIINIFREIWRDQIEIVDSVEVLKEDLKIDSVSYKILINPKLITFQYPKFNQITLNTNYRFSGHITLYPQTVRFTPVGIGKKCHKHDYEFHG